MDEIPEGYKRCSRGNNCVHPDGPLLPVGEFHKNKTRKDGLCKPCKACHIEDSKRWRRANPDKEIEKARRWRQAHPEKANEKAKRWRKANPEKITKYVNNRRARKLELPNTLTGEQWIACQEYFNHQCAVCGSMDNIQCDHWIPLQPKKWTPKVNLGTVSNNTVHLCLKCNYSKGSKEPRTWLLDRVGEDQYEVIIERIYGWFDAAKGLENETIKTNS